MQSFDRTRRTLGWFVAPLAFATVLLLPTGLEPPAHRLAAVFALVIVLWITEAIPLPATALLGVALTVPLGIASAHDAFANFGHPILFLFVGGFLISQTMVTHGLDRRVALFVLSRRWVGERPERILLAFGGIAWVLSMWMSNTATTAMMLPIALGVLRTLENDAPETPETRAYGTGLLLMVAYACNVGGIATPVGSPTNLIAIGMIERIAGIRIGFFDWMRWALPISAGLFVLVYAVIRLLVTGRRAPLDGVGAMIARRRAELGGWNAGERAALVAFLTAVALWILPGLSAILAGRDALVTRLLNERLPEGVAAILAASLLFLIPVDWRERRFALGWREATRIDWGTILLFGGGMSLGTLAFKTGLAAALGVGIDRAAGLLPLAVVVIFAVLVADGMTEIMSNTATANLLIPIFLAMAAAGNNSLLPALGATLGCSLAFCLPVATPPNAIVYGSGRVPLSTMIRAGLVLDVGCALIVWLGLLTLAG